MAAPCARISVVMPSLNHGRFIAEAIDSVFAQSGDPVAELIVADGGSSDSTHDEVLSAQRRYPGRVRWHREADSGPAQAVNRAVRLAEQDLIGWLNADDRYLPGALSRALGRIDARPGTVMVYGHAIFVAETGAPAGRYPTLPPTTPLQAFAQGCFICQPTVLLRASSFLALGGLDERLATAFDFDLWMRFFERFPSGIGFVDEVQAASRLHAQTITARQRERVAVEGIRVLHRHLGAAPPHWLLTHFDERCATHPFDGATPSDLRADLERLLQACRSGLEASGVEQVRLRLSQDRSLQIATPWLFAGVHPDGWAPPRLELRLRQPPRPAVALRLRGRNLHPAGQPLRLRAQGCDAEGLALVLPGNGPFTWTLPIADRTAGAQLVISVQTEAPFQPASVEPGSTDQRLLAFQLDAVDLVQPS